MKETFINDACSPMSFLCHSVLDTVSSETYFNAYRSASQLNDTEPEILGHQITRYE